MANGDTLGKCKRCALEKLDRRQRNVIGGVAVETRGKSAHLRIHGPRAHVGGVCAPAPSARCISTVSTHRSNLRPTAASTPACSNPSVACNAIDAAFCAP